MSDDGSKVTPEVPTPVDGFCNKCGYAGPCEVIHAGILSHPGRGGRECGYSAVRLSKREDETCEDQTIDKFAPSASASAFSA